MNKLNPLVRDMRNTTLAIVGMIARATEVTVSPHIDHRLARECWTQIHNMVHILNGITIQIGNAEFQAATNFTKHLAERKSLIDQDYATVKQIFDDLPSRYSNQPTQYPDNVDPYCVGCHTKMSLEQLEKATEYGQWEGKERLRCERCQEQYEENIRKGTDMPELWPSPR